MGPLLSLEGSFGEDVGRLVLGWHVPQADAGVILQAFEQPIKSNSLSPAAMFVDRTPALDDRGNDGIVILQDKKSCPFCNRRPNWIHIINSPWVT